MALLRRIVRLLDRPGGRGLLAALLQRWLVLERGRALRRLEHDGEFWRRRVGGTWWVDGPRLTTAWSREVRRWPDAGRTLREAPRDYWFHVYRPRPGDVIVDVGAGAGDDALAFSRAVGPEGRVIAVEAHPVTFARLERFCALNRLANVTPVRAAAMDREGAVRLDERGSDVVCAIAPPEEGAGRGLSAPGVRLEDLLARLGVGRVDLLKMNIEGAERLALEGMGRALDRVSHACIACHDFLASEGAEARAWVRTRDAVTELLSARGFRTLRREDDPRPFVRDHVHAWREG